MNNKDSNQVNIPNPNNLSVHEYYAKMPYWTKGEAILILASSRDHLISEASRALWIIKQSTKNGHQIPYMDLLERAVEHYELPTKEQRDPDSSHFVRCFRPLDFIKWAKKKEITLPEGLEELVNKYCDQIPSEKIDLEDSYIKSKSKIHEQEAEITALKKELSIPHSKRKVSLHKGFIGLLAMKYGHDKVLKNFGKDATAYNLTDKNKITLVKISNDFAEQGIDIDDSTIRDLISDSVHHLSTKQKQ